MVLDIVNHSLKCSLCPLTQNRSFAARQELKIIHVRVFRVEEISCQAELKPACPSSLRRNSGTHLPISSSSSLRMAVQGILEMRHSRQTV